MFQQYQDDEALAFIQDRRIPMCEQNGIHTVPSLVTYDVLAEMEFRQRKLITLTIQRACN